VEENEMTDDNFVIIGFIIAIILVGGMVTISVTTGNNLEVKKSCFESNKTYFKYSTQTYDINTEVNYEFCGDITMINELIKGLEK
jgi:hypothetical protein